MKYILLHRRFKVCLNVATALLYVFIFYLILADAVFFRSRLLTLLLYLSILAASLFCGIRIASLYKKHENLTEARQYDKGVDFAVIFILPTLALAAGAIVKFITRL